MFIDERGRDQRGSDANRATAGLLNTDWNPRDVPAGTVTQNAVVGDAGHAEIAHCRAFEPRGDSTDRPAG